MHDDRLLRRPLHRDPLVWFVVALALLALERGARGSVEWGAPFNPDRLATVLAVAFWAMAGAWLLLLLLALIRQSWRRRSGWSGATSAPTSASAAAGTSGPGLPSGPTSTSRRGTSTSTSRRGTSPASPRPEPVVPPRRAVSPDATQTSWRLDLYEDLPRLPPSPSPSPSRRPPSP